MLIILFSDSFEVRLFEERLNYCLVMTDWATYVISKIIQN